MTTKISKRLLFEWWTFPCFTQERCPRTQNLKLEFYDTFKTNNSSSQEADVSDHIAGYVAFKAVKYCKN